MFHQLLHLMIAAAGAFNAGMTPLSKVLKGPGNEANKITRLYLYAQDENKTNNALKNGQTGKSQNGCIRHSQSAVNVMASCSAKVRDIGLG